MMTNPVTALQSENKNLKAENKKLRDELRGLREFVNALDGLSNIQKKEDGEVDVFALLDGILWRALKLLNAPDGSLALLDHDKNELAFVLVHGALGAELEGFRMPADEGIAGWVVKNAEATLVRDVARDQRFFKGVDERFKFNTLSIAAAPLVGGGRIIGVIEVLNQPGDKPFSEDDMALLRLLCRFAGQALADIERGDLASK